MEYSFCETVTANPFTFWHIRPLTSNGQKFGGGADTKSLCDKIVSWDLIPRITEFNLEKNSCAKCRIEYIKIKRNIITIQ